MSTPISGIIRLRIIYPKNHEYFKNSKSGSNFTGSYKRNSLPGVYTTLWKSPCLYTCICSYGFYVSLKAFMVITVPFIHNWKALNIFIPVGERGGRNVLGEINTEPKCFVYVSLINSITSNKL